MEDGELSLLTPHLSQIGRRFYSVIPVKERHPVLRYGAGTHPPPRAARQSRGGKGDPRRAAY